MLINRVREIGNFDNLPDFTCARDDRPGLKTLYKSYSCLAEAGWEATPLYSQEIEVDGQSMSVPILAFESRPKIPRERCDLVLLGGIHGREPIGPVLLAQEINSLIVASQKIRILILPLCNPFGLHNDQRLGPDGISVTDCDSFLGRSDIPPSPECLAITSFLAKKLIGERTLVFDLHEDPLFEYDDPKPKQKNGGYIYVASRNLHSPTDYPPIILKTVAYLRETIGLVMSDNTREGEKELILKGVVLNPEDGSIDELLAQRAFLVVTTEIRLENPTEPPLEERVKIGKGILDLFLEEAMTRATF